jgi:hypothetical protein
LEWLKLSSEGINKMDWNTYNERKTKLQEELNNLEKEYLDHSPFKMGELVIHSPSGKKYYIGEINPGYSSTSSNPYTYVLFVPKKDGTMPKKPSLGNTFAWMKDIKKVE